MRRQDTKRGGGDEKELEQAEIEEEVEAEKKNARSFHSLNEWIDIPWKETQEVWSYILLYVIKSRE